MKKWSVFIQLPFREFHSFRASKSERLANFVKFKNVVWRILRLRSCEMLGRVRKLLYHKHQPLLTRLIAETKSSALYVRKVRVSDSFLLCPATHARMEITILVRSLKSSILRFNSFQLEKTNLLRSGLVLLFYTSLGLCD